MQMSARWVRNIAGLMQVCFRPVTAYFLKLAAASLGILAVLICTERVALAYTDPGSGALIWQMSSACLVGALFFMRRILNRFRQWKSRKNAGMDNGNKEPGR
jgi:hypothetical protein